LNLHLEYKQSRNKSDNIDNWNQVVMKEGTSTTSFSFKDLASINYTILANRAILFSYGIVEIIPQDIEIIANNYMVVPDELKRRKVNLGC
jgi:hypothetical protein